VADFVLSGRKNNIVERLLVLETLESIWYVLAAAKKVFYLTREAPQD
jgi:hypothetical protein